MDTKDYENHKNQKGTELSVLPFLMPDFFSSQVQLLVPLEFRCRRGQHFVPLTLSTRGSKKTEIRKIFLRSGLSREDQRYLRHKTQRDKTS